MRIYKIALTGGPCVEKTDVFNFLTKRLKELNYNVITVHETAREFIENGIPPHGDNEYVIKFQNAILNRQLQKEQDAITLLKDEPTYIILCDRGIMDSKAYLSNLQFSSILNSLNKKEVELRDNYDAVFHLVTAAKGAEKFYSKETNSARRENLEEARLADDRTLSAWAGHPHLRVIDNSTGFEDKIRRLIREISSYLGEPQPYEIERKFLIKYPDLKALNNPTLEKVDIIQTYLRKSNPNEEIRIRQRGCDGHFIYTRTIKKGTGQKRLETEKRISKDQYLTYLMDADQNYHQIRKTRYCFVYNNQYLELDIYPFWKDKAILEIEINNENGKVEIPPEIEVIKEVTNDPHLKNSYIAKNYEKFNQKNP